jgi:hypothetical protein
MGGSKLVVAVLALAIAGATGYWIYAENQKKEQQRAVAQLLGDTTAHLRKALNGPPPPELVAHLDGNLKAAKAPRDKPLADAAGSYIQGAREIARRRAEAEKLSREAAKSRRALSMHMAAASGRDAYWIRIASDLKKRVEREHHDLEVTLKGLNELLLQLPDSQRELQARQVDAALLLEEKERAAARKRAEEDSKRAADELEKVRKLAMPR